MYINKPTDDLLDVAIAIKDLQHFIQQPDARQLPPCPNCNQHIPGQCTASCHDAPRALSSEPDKYPIEAKVTPLVFELMSTRLMQPCWSCEGHMSSDIQYMKIPQVCFYSASPLYPNLLLRYLSRLEQQKRLSYHWQIIFTDFSQTLGITYSIQPDLNLNADPHLGRLQMDLQTIAQDLTEQLKAIARDLLKEYEKASA